MARLAGKNYIGIEIGGSKLQMLAADARGKILTRVRLTVEKSAGAAGIRNQIKMVLPKMVVDFSASAIGVGFGGPVNWKTGKIARSHQIEGWSGFSLVHWLETLSGLPVRADNDANVAALGEAILGAGSKFDPVFYVTLGSGVGGGLVVNKQIYHGLEPGESEIGHVRLDRAGAIVESRCSGWAVDARIRALKLTEPESVLCKLCRDVTPCEARFLAEALAEGDVSARRILKETSEDLAFGLSHVVHLFHPAVIVLGGGLALIGEPLRKAVAEFLPGFVMPALQPGLRVALSKLKEDAVPLGAIELARGTKILS
jgi:glucokinase